MPIPLSVVTISHTTQQDPVSHTLTIPAGRAAQQHPVFRTLTISLPLCQSTTGHTEHPELKVEDNAPTPQWMGQCNTSQN